MPNANHAQQNNKLLIQINSRFNETIKAFHIARNNKTDTDAYKVRVPFQGKRILPVANVRGRQCTHFPIKCRVHLTNTYTNVDTENTQAKKSVVLLSSLTCSMTSGAIQHGVPTKVCRTFCRLRSRPVASHALTPKSAICTVPSSP